MRLDNLPRDVAVYEVAPRDGLQNEATQLSTGDKVAFIEGLVDCGLKHIELTSFVSPKWIPALADHAEVARRVRRKPDVAYSALVPNQQGLDAALAAGLQEVAVFLSSTETHNQRNINKSIDETLELYRALVAQAQQRGARVRAYVSTVFGCPYEGEVNPKKPSRIARALIEMGCYQVSLGDTIGVGTPRHVEQTLDVIAEEVGANKLALHFHDTRGTALANVLVGLGMGITTVDSSAGGMGGCPYAPGAAGNVATEDVVYMLDGMGIHTGVNLDALCDVSVRMEKLLGRTLPSKVLRATLGARERLRKAQS
jgi:hydroxymethylglutaryl-CoA lyase